MKGTRGVGGNRNRAVGAGLGYKGKVRCVDAGDGARGDVDTGGGTDGDGDGLGRLGEVEHRRSEGDCGGRDDEGRGGKEADGEVWWDDGLGRLKRGDRRYEVIEGGGVERGIVREVEKRSDGVGRGSAARGQSERENVPQTELSPDTPPAELTHAASRSAMVLIWATGTE